MSRVITITEEDEITIDHLFSEDMEIRSALHLISKTNLSNRTLKESIVQ